MPVPRDKSVHELLTHLWDEVFPEKKEEDKAPDSPADLKIVETPANPEAPQNEGNQS